MSYELNAVIGDAGLLRVRAGEPARLGALEGGLAVMPMTSALFDALTDGSAAGLGFWRLPGGFDRVLAGWSADGPLAYVEAEYFGGTGTQRPAVWAGGELAFGPLGVAEGEPFPPAGSPISQALRRLGVERGDAVDEFAAAGLYRHRHGAAWIS
ncbi:hypothetical protein [Actinomadura sp. DC4]|uniref:hypothetical protein n=1 Tax=Actinomadura sp. DC4 TaxID=3055069 RepID=UPI0025B14A57|nr:hypothetical protein [Actinomadura sp. DC4]MDN3359847.1 hypothetical protein [Actinomadura sp. DC4]